MKYSELLSKYIEESGLSLGEIAKRVSEEKGINIDRSYISMLKNNKTKNPASEELSRAIAEVTGGNPTELVVAGYLEKAPSEIKALIDRADKNERFFEKLLSVVDLNIVVEDDPEQTQYFNDTKDTINSPEFLRNLDPSTRNYILLNTLTNMFEHAPQAFESFNSQVIKTVSNESRNLIPLIGSICAGDGLLAENNVEDLIHYPSASGRQPDFALRVKGDSMRNAGIDDGDIVYLKSAKWADHNGQIVAVIMREDDHGSLKRIRWSSDEAGIMLIAENEKYEPKSVLPNEIIVCGVYMGHFKPEKVN